MFPPDIHDLAVATVKSYARAGRRLALAESCTGGLIAGAITQIPGASEVFDRGFVTYSNASKQTLLNVPSETLQAHGAVSPETAEAMAAGALASSDADIALSVTGIAGPDGGSPEKPVGLVIFGLAERSGATFHCLCRFRGDRDSVRSQAIVEALTLLSTAVAPRRASRDELDFANPAPDAL